MEEELILKLSDIKKSFGGVNALEGMQLEVHRGEILALVGENGAGKSTLMKILLGIHTADEGTMWFKGTEGFFKTPAAALSAGIAMIHQEICLVPTLTVAENIWLGREKQFYKHGFVDGKKRSQATKQLLDKIGLAIDPNTIVGSLSIAMMQLVELARAVSYDSDILIMDEPTSALTDKESEQMIGIMHDLASKGAGIIFISHKLEEVLRVADRCAVLRDGKFIGNYSCDEMDTQTLIKLIANRELNNLFKKTHRDYGDKAIEIKNLCSDKVQNVSFYVRQGEVYGLSGLMGAGRSEIARAIFGIDKYDSGEILIDGVSAVIKSPKQAVEHKMAMVTEDRLRMGAIYPFSVLYNTTLTAFRWLCNKFAFYSKKRERQKFMKYADMLSVKYSSPNETIGQLSGGNQQKVILSRALMINPKILILDEPTRGIDVGAKAEIYSLIDKWASQGIAVILISSELPELLGLSDRIGVVCNGQLVFECDQKDATQELLMKHAFGFSKDA